MRSWNEYQYVSIQNAEMCGRKGINADIFAVSADEALTKLETRPVDIILLGPQVRYMKGKFEAKAAEHDIAIDVINMQDYGMMNGENVLESAMALIN